MSKRVSTGLSIHINENYTLSLEREDGRPVGLYRVILRTPLTKRSAYVLAEDEQGAIGQACYGWGFDVWNKKEKWKEHCRAVRLPMFVRGWGKTTF